MIRPHLFAFLVVTVGGFVGGWISANQFYTQHITTIEERLALRSDEIGRLRVALGVDPASKGALIALTNEELKAKSVATADRLRNLCISLRDRSQAIDANEQSGKIDAKGATERWLALVKEAS